MLTKLFVYGSLRKGYHNHHYLDGKATYLGTYYIKGNLYEIKGKNYPALVKDDNVYTVGELYDVLVDFKQMDEMENYNPNNIEKSEYIRTIEDVYDENLQKVESVYIYLYNTKLKDTLGKQIENNDFKNFRK